MAQADQQIECRSYAYEHDIAKPEFAS